MTYSRYKHMYSDQPLFHPLAIVLAVFVSGWVSAEHYYGLISSNQWGDRMVISVAILVLLDPVIKSVVWLKKNFSFKLNIEPR